MYISAKVSVLFSGQLVIWMCGEKVVDAKIIRLFYRGKYLTTYYRTEDCNNSELYVVQFPEKKE